jgi:hypothetical protein
MKRTGPAYSSVVHEQVHAAERFLRGGHDPRQTARIRDIGGQEPGQDPVFRKPFGYLREFGRRSGGEHEIHTPPRQSSTDVRTDATRCARYYCGPTP